MENNIINKLPHVAGEYKSNELLKKYTWLNVGGPADVMFFPKDKEDLQKFLLEKPADIDVFVLGSGSNLLVRDGGISGVVVNLKSSSFNKIEIADNIIQCGAGLKNSFLKKIMIENEISGLEFLCSIPGSLGGALRTNAGCFGSEISNVLQSATVIDSAGRIFTVENKDFNFSYRKSDFPSDWIILEVCLKGIKSAKEQIISTIETNAEYRKKNQPQNVRTAGSTFKNPKGYKAWELIKNSGAADFKVGGASMSSKHCNFLINDGTATASDIEHLGNNIINAVKDKYGVELEWEIKIIGKEI